MDISAKTDRLAEIEQGLAEHETAWSEFEFGQSHFETALENQRWLIAEVERLRAELDAVRQVANGPAAVAVLREVERLREALVKHHGEPNGMGCEICDLADV